MQCRWPTGFSCPACGHSAHCLLPSNPRMTFQCSAGHRQTSLIAGSLFQESNLPLTIWFLAIYLVSQAKTRPSALALKRHLGVSNPTAWLIHHKLMQAMAKREDLYRLSGAVQIDDVFRGGERRGGKAGRGSENKIPFVAAVSVDDEGHPGRIKLTPVPGFTSPCCTVLSDGLACFGCVSAASCLHIPIVAGRRKPGTGGVR
ncbi:transposase (fragment) [Candidatus Methylobacter favarea]|uniref:Transposase n=1 Tax=Candidatus Methylobacter favarea TaxID=2707345 RepID=A0A8S0WC61_9GAMM